MYDTEITVNEAVAEYSSALAAFAKVAKRIIAHTADTNEVLVETLKLQKDVLLNVGPKDEE